MKFENYSNKQSIEIVVHSKSLFQQKFQKKLYHFNRKSQLRVWCENDQEDCQSQTKKSDSATLVLCLFTNVCVFQVRRCALDAILAIGQKLGPDYITMVPDTVPFLAELMEGMMAATWCKTNRVFFTPAHVMLFLKTLWKKLFFNELIIWWNYAWLWYENVYRPQVSSFLKYTRCQASLGKVTYCCHKKVKPTDQQRFCRTNFSATWLIASVLSQAGNSKHSCHFFCWYLFSVSRVCCKHDQPKLVAVN